MSKPVRPDLLSQAEICGQLGISDQTWLRWRKARKTPEAIVLPSGRLKWRAVDIDALAGKAAISPAAASRRYFGSIYLQRGA